MRSPTAFPPFSRMLLMLAALLLLATQAQAQAQPDLTGTYMGKASCKGVDATGLKESNKMALVMMVSQPVTGQTSADLQVLTQLVDPKSQVVVGVYYWFGHVRFDPGAPDRKGQGTVNECSHLANPGTTAAYQLAHFTYSVSPGDVKGSIKFNSISDFLGENGAIAGCKASLKRVDVTDPAVAFCP